MTSIVQTIHKKTTLMPSKQSLPVSSPADEPTLRRRLSLSSLSLSLQPAAPAAAASWAIHRSKSLSSMGENAGTSIKNWWAWAWAWIVTRKPTFAADLEMNEEEKLLIGSQNRGSVMHIFYKVKSEVRKLFRFDDMSLPQTQTQNFRYDSSTTRNGFKRGAYA